jgi:glycosyltransferase involved in cell wall biosynthesis
VDCDMPPRVTYWTGTWDPKKEAISKEINALRVGSRARSPVTAISSGQRSRLLFDQRVIQLSDRSWPALRVVAAAVEPCGHVTHIFGGRSSWHLLRALGRRPILITAAVAGDRSKAVPHVKIARVAVEASGLIKDWTDLGIERHRIEIIRPGIDLDWFHPVAPRPSTPFTLLFASTPSEAGEIAARGIPLLVELARMRPDIRILVPWRQWGDEQKSRQMLADLRPSSNFLVTHDRVNDMREFYAKAHATIVCFHPGVGKASPNFVIEGLASGLPCVSTPGVGLAGDLLESGAGIVSADEVGALSQAIDALRASLPGFAARAVAVARDRFDVRKYLSRYEEIYTELSQSSPM